MIMSQFFKPRNSNAIVTKEFKLIKAWLESNRNLILGEIYEFTFSQPLNFVEKFALAKMVNALSDKHVTIQVGISTKRNWLIISTFDHDEDIRNSPLHLPYYPPKILTVYEVENPTINLI